MYKTIPIRDLKDTANISRLCDRSKEPIVVTKNGYASMVLMNADVFNKYEDEMEQIRVARMLREADEAERNGDEGRDFYDFLDDFKKMP